MSAQDFLVELGTEELPPKALKSLGEAFLAGVEKGLKSAGLTTCRPATTPRRAVWPCLSSACRRSSRIAR